MAVWKCTAGENHRAMRLGAMSAWLQASRGDVAQLRVQLSRQGEGTQGTAYIGGLRCPDLITGSLS